MAYNEQYNHFKKLHATYENKAYRILIKEFQTLLKSIPFRNITPENAENLVLFNIKDENLRKAILKVHLVIGNSYGEIIARQLKNEKRRFPLFSEAFQQFVINYFKNEGYLLITTITQTMAREVMRIVSEISKDKVDIFEMRKAIEKAVTKPDFYKWQALRIARTETTSAMNSAKYIAGDVSGLVLDKIWLHGGSLEPRNSHLALDGKAVAQNENFNVEGHEMKYPGDKNGGASQVINCTCTYVYKPRRDSNGNLMRKN